MNEQQHKELVEASWRRNLSPEEEATLQLYLAARPEIQADWEDELALGNALRDLPDAPLSSNFTSQVLQALDREERVVETPTIPFWRQWMPRLATAATVVVLLFTGLNLHRANNRTNVRETVVPVTYIATAVEPRVFEDFEAIQQLRTAPQFSDDELVQVLLR
jgi:hypothetical protein